MRGVRICDMHERGFLAVDLQHILDLFGERTIQSQWRASEVWETGEAGEELERLADAKTLIPGDRLSDLAHHLVQVIDGEFAGFESGNDSPWIIIRAVDSTFYEVLSEEPAVLDRVRAAFQKVSDSESPT